MLYFTLALSHIKKDLYIKNGTVERIVRPSVAPAAHFLSIATKLFPVLDLVLPCDCSDSRHHTHPHSWPQGRGWQGAFEVCSEGKAPASPSTT